MSNPLSIWKRSRPVGVMFHRLHCQGEKPTGQGSIHGKDFERILLTIGIENILNPTEWIERFRSNQLTNNEVCLTFDDGLASQFAIALPILNQYNIKAFFFIYTKVYENIIDSNEIASYLASQKFDLFLEYFNEFQKYFNIMDSDFEEPIYIKMKEDYNVRFPFYSSEDIFYRYWRNNRIKKSDFDSFVQYLIKFFGLSQEWLLKEIWLTEKQLIQLDKEGHCIGLHSHTHPFSMASEPVEIQTKEYEENYQRIKKIIDKNPASMSHPLGSYSEGTLEILSRMKINIGFRSDDSLNTFGNLELPRIDSAFFLNFLF